MISFRYSIWLMPCAEQRAMLEETINELAVRFGTLTFMPHATLCSGVWKKREAELVEAVEKVGTHLRGVRPSAKLRTGGRLGQPSLPMKVVGIDWTDDWATFFFVRLTGADDLFSQAARFVEGAHSPEIGPHLSLLYSFGDQPIDREALRAEVAGSLPETIRFDALALVRPESGRWEDVASWKVRLV